MILSDIETAITNIFKIKKRAPNTFLFFTGKNKMCLTVTHPPPGFFFWNWNKVADEVLDLLNAL